MSAAAVGGPCDVAPAGVIVKRILDFLFPFCRRTPAQLACYTFGCPRVGNPKFIQQFNAKVPESWRVYNALDTVARVPRMTGFVQPDNSVAFQRTDTSTKIAFKNPDLDLEGPLNVPVCGEVCY